MIEFIRINGLKRFHEQQIDFRALTILTGPNGTGKSTVLQAIKLMRSASQSLQGFIELNRSELDLGEAQDILENTTEVGAGIRLIARVDGSDVAYRLEVPEVRSLRVAVTEKPERPPEVFGGRESFFTHLTADRLGPRHTLEAVALDAQDVNVGGRGEATAQVLSQLDTFAVRPELHHPATAELGARGTLPVQTEMWLSSIVRPVQVEAQWILGTNVTTLRFKDPGWRGEWLKPSNVGFGLTHALPIIVAGLAAPANSILLVENPEAHLHPRAQSAIAAFLAKVAHSGVQVVVETHSDHVVNGFRLAVAVSGLLGHEQILIQYFGGTEATPVEQIQVLATGELTNWPDGFFDQIEVDLGTLARSRRRP